jgi:chromosome segregation ATPase
MFNTITIVLVLLTLSAVAAAVFAIGWLSRVKRHLSELGMRVLESQDVGKIKEAANRTESFESRMAGCEQKADGSENQLVEHETKLSELADKLGASEQKMASLEVRFDELSTKLGSVEQVANKNEDGLAQTIPNIKALADEIQSLKMFQTATEKVHSLIQSAFTDMQAGMPSEEVLGTTPEDAQPEEASQGPEEASQEPEEWNKEAQDQKVSGSRRWQS